MPMSNCILKKKMLLSLFNYRNKLTGKWTLNQLNQYFLLAYLICIIIEKLRMLFCWLFQFSHQLRIIFQWTKLSGILKIVSVLENVLKLCCTVNKYWLPLYFSGRIFFLCQRIILSGIFISMDCCFMRKTVCKQFELI